MNVENYREQSPNEKFIALFDLYLPKIALTFRNLKLCKNKYGKHFIGYPSFLVHEDESGKKIFGKYAEFSKERQKAFEDEIFNALAPFVKEPISRFTER